MNAARQRRRSGARLAARLFALAVTVVATAASAAHAGSMEIESFEAGLSSYQAGGHPDTVARFRFVTETHPQNDGSCFANPDGICEIVKGGAPKDIAVDLPRGLFGDPRGIPQCSLSDLTKVRCPVASQVGSIDLDLMLEKGNLLALPDEAVFNVIPERGEVAKLGFRVAGTVNSFVSLKVRPDKDYALTATSENIFTGLPLWGAELTIWGSPYDAVNDPLRVCQSNLGCSAGVPVRPFMVAPSECGVDGRSTLRVRSYQQPGDDDWTSADSTPHQVTGCERLTFRPTISVRPTTTAPDAPTGLDVDLAFPQHFDDPAGLETPPLKDAVVTLPEGMTINPSSAAGLEACSDAQLPLRSNAPIACPQASKIGTLEAETPVLAEQLTGGIYLRTQNSSDPESGELFRIALVLENSERGLSIRLPGAIRANRATGRIEAVFRDNPQLPVTRIALRFKSGPRAPLATPPTCGSHTVSARLSSWGGQSAELSDAFTIDCGTGLGTFNPFLSAGTVNPAAGATSPLVVRFGREDGQQALRDLSIDLPEGLLARLADLRALCDPGPAAAGTCDEGSRIGSVVSAAGAGSNPLYLPGRVYMTGPYKGAPFGLSIVVPAVAGPFDLGTVVVRAAVHVDRHDASLRIVSDPMPAIVGGVPLRLRSVEVNTDRPRFTLNPTDCTPSRVDASLGSMSGALARLASRFQAGGCAALPFKPKLAIKVGRRGRTHAGVTTPLQATLTMTPDQANNSEVRVTLPKAINARLEVVRRACTLEAFQAGNCGSGARIGSAVAITPLLRDPLRGPAYLVRNPARRLPDVVVPLRGQVDFDLVGKVTIPRDLTLRTSFDTVPDVPISKFILRLVPGRTGIVGAVDNLCSARTRRGLKAKLSFRAQSGKLVAGERKMSVAGCGRGADRRKGKQRRPAPRRAAQSVRAPRRG